MNYYNPYMNFNSYQQLPPLNGKVVDNIDMVKVAEVPIGGYGVFPKADLTEIYVKAWSPNGTTNTITYKPNAEIPQATASPKNDIADRLAALEEKLDALLEKKGVSVNDY